jgi:hypothetical protein
VLIYAVTVALDLQTLDAGVPCRLIAPVPLMPGAQRKIPGGIIVFQSAVLSNIPGEPSLYRFAVQFGAQRAAGTVGNWLFSKLRNEPVSIALAGHPLPLDHHSLIVGLKQVA